MKKNPYMVDVPVRVNIWIRPECQRKQFEVLKKARPSIMFLISDGGRNEKEWDAIKENRKIFDTEVDWECQIYKVYESKNNGLYTMARKGSELIWSKVDRCVFLEDDYVPSVSYFSYCADLLEKYKDDTRINAICAMNHVGVWEKASSDYFFSEAGSIWGIATWKRTHEMRNDCFNYVNDSYTVNLLKERAKKDKLFIKSVVGYAKNENYGGHVAGGEFYYNFQVYGQNQLFIVPKRNMMCNIGCTSDSAHAAQYYMLPRGIRKIFNMKTHELECPLKHPGYVIADKGYAKAAWRIMAVGHPIVSLYRKIECCFLALKYKGLSGVFKKMKKSKKRKHKIET